MAASEESEEPLGMDAFDFWFEQTQRQTDSIRSDPSVQYVTQADLQGLEQQIEQRIDRKFDELIRVIQAGRRTMVHQNTEDGGQESATPNPQRITPFPASTGQTLPSHETDRVTASEEVRRHLNGQDFQGEQDNQTVDSRQGSTEEAESRSLASGGSLQDSEISWRDSVGRSGSSAEYQEAIERVPIDPPASMEEIKRVFKDAGLSESTKRANDRAFSSVYDEFEIAVDESQRQEQFDKMVMELRALLLSGTTEDFCSILERLLKYFCNLGSSDFTNSNRDSLPSQWGIRLVSHSFMGIHQFLQYQEAHPIPELGDASTELLATEEHSRRLIQDELRNAPTVAKELMELLRSMSSTLVQVTKEETKESAEDSSILLKSGFLVYRERQAWGQAGVAFSKYEGDKVLDKVQYARAIQRHLRDIVVKVLQDEPQFSTLVKEIQSVHTQRNLDRYRIEGSPLDPLLHSLRCANEGLAALLLLKRQFRDSPKISPTTLRVLELAKPNLPQKGPLTHILRTAAAHIVSQVLASIVSHVRTLGFPETLITDEQIMFPLMLNIYVASSPKRKSKLKQALPDQVQHLTDWLTGIHQQNPTFLTAVNLCVPYDENAQGEAQHPFSLKVIRGLLDEDNMKGPGAHLGPPESEMPHDYVKYFSGSPDSLYPKLGLVESGKMSSNVSGAKVTKGPAAYVVQGSASQRGHAKVVGKTFDRTNFNASVPTLELVNARSISANLLSECFDAMAQVRSIVDRHKEFQSDDLFKEVQLMRNEQPTLVVILVKQLPHALVPEILAERPAFRQEVAAVYWRTKERTDTTVSSVNPDLCFARAPKKVKISQDARASYPDGTHNVGDNANKAPNRWWGPSQGRDHKAGPQQSSKERSAFKQRKKSSNANGGRAVRGGRGGGRGGIPVSQPDIPKTTLSFAEVVGAYGSGGSSLGLSGSITNDGPLTSFRMMATDSPSVTEEPNKQRKPRRNRRKKGARRG